MKRRDQNDPSTLAIAARLRTLRLTRDMSMEEIGALVGVTFQQVQKYENGSNRIPVDRLQRLAQALEVPVSYFFETYSGPPGAGLDASDAIKQFCADPMGFRMAQAFIRLPERSRRAAVEMVEGVARIQPAE